MKKSYKVLLADGFSVLNSDGTQTFKTQNSIIYVPESEATEMIASFPNSLLATNHWKSVIAASQVDEAITSSDANTLTAGFTVLDVQGVWLATDTGHTGTNYFTGGSWSGTTITLGTALPGATTNVIVNYTSDGRTVTTTGGAITYSKTLYIPEVSGKQMVKVDFITEGTMPAGATLNVKPYLSTSLRETRTRTLGSVATTTSTVYVTPAMLEGADSLVISGTVPQASGSNYKVKINATIIDASSIADGATFTIGTEAADHIDVDVQLRKNAVALTSKSVVTCYLSSDQLGATPVETADSVAIQTNGTIFGNIPLTWTPGTPALGYTGVEVESNTSGIFTLRITEAGGAVTYYLNVVFADGTKITSDAIVFAA